jgi:L-alanine-DL-glutamate epimerase-like enolase superfamily enzyme
VKVKVGVGDDVARVAAVRAALGPEPRLRVDANGAWSPADAPERLRALAPFGLELCEEPVHGVEALRTLRAAAPLPLALDETATAANALVPGVADFACLKLAAWGGISPLIAAATRARRAGMGVYLASSLDGPVGIAAARDAAAALGPDAACGLATLSAFANVPERDL